jgi:hypothetical protein
MLELSCATTQKRTHKMSKMIRKDVSAIVETKKEELGSVLTKEFTSKKAKRDAISKAVIDTIYICFEKIDILEMLESVHKRIAQEINNIRNTHRDIYDSFPQLQDFNDPEEVYDCFSNWSTKASTYDKIDMLRQCRQILLDRHDVFCDYAQKVEKYIDDDLTDKLDELDSSYANILDSFEGDINRMINSLSALKKKSLEFVESVNHNYSTPGDDLVRDFKILESKINQLNPDLNEVPNLFSKIYESKAYYLQGEINGGDWLHVLGEARAIIDDLSALVKFIEFCSGMILMTPGKDLSPIEIYQSYDVLEAKVNLIDICRDVDNDEEPINKESSVDTLISDEVAKIRSEIDSLNLRLEKLLAKPNQ